MRRVTSPKLLSSRHLRSRDTMLVAQRSASLKRPSTEPQPGPLALAPALFCLEFPQGKELKTFFACEKKFLACELL